VLKCASDIDLLVMDDESLRPGDWFASLLGVTKMEPDNPGLPGSLPLERKW